jgi:hypothetical protein
LPRSVTPSTDEVLVPNEPTAALQESVAPEDTVRAASPEIQEAEEGAGAALLQGAAGGEAQTLELACTPWAATSRSGNDAKDDEEVAARNTLEHGLNWARRAFDELILPATSVRFLVWNSSLQFSGSCEKCYLFLFCSGQTLTSSGRRRARAVRELRGERAQLEMQLVVARVAATAAMSSEASARTSL